MKTIREIVAQLQQLEVDLAFIQGADETQDDLDANENIGAARDHLCDAIDALRNN